jgi:hypothetical protein
MAMALSLCAAPLRSTIAGPAPGMAGASCEVESLGGKCSITCLSGYEARCVPGRSYYEGNSLVVVPSKCDCVRTGAAAAADKETCGGSSTVEANGSRCGISCPAGMQASCVPGHSYYEGINLVSVPPKCECSRVQATSVPEKDQCGGSCSMGYGGTCKVTCPPGKQAHCKPGGWRYEGLSLVTYQPKCECQ